MRRLPISLALVISLLPAPLLARSTPAERCVAARLRVAAKLVDTRLRCIAAAAAKGAAVDPTNPACDAIADARLRSAFLRIAGRAQCATPVDRTTIDAPALTAFVGTVATAVGAALRPTPDANRCASKKLRVSGKIAFAGLACRARALVTHRDDTPCRVRLAAVLARSFANAERRATCLTTDDAAAIAALLLPVADSVVDYVDPRSHPSGLAAAIGADVDLAWTAPDPSSGHTHVKIVRTLNAPPTGPDDPAATQVFFGTTTAATDPLTALLPDTSGTPRTYHYAAFGCTAGGACVPSVSRATLAPTVTELLRAGGYVIHWRHATATVCRDRIDLGTASTTSVPDWWKSCDATCPEGGPVTATARQLSTGGMMEATIVGEAIRARAIPIGRVLTSEYCRSFTSAELMSFGPPLEYRPDITLFVHATETERCANTLLLLAETPAAGTNTAIVAHGGCPEVGDLAMAAAAIHKPNGAGGSTLIDVVLATGWAALP